jgi:putative transposase
MIATKCITQTIQPNQDIDYIMKIFKEMLNKSIRIGIKNNVKTLKKLSLLSYHDLDSEYLMKSYKLMVVSQACGILSKHKKELKKNPNAKFPVVTKPFLVNCYGFKINGYLLSIPFKPHQHINILLNDHTQKILSDNSIKVKSFTISNNRLSLCVQKQVEPIKPESVLGIDRNLRNVTVGNHQSVTFYKTNKLLSIKENTIHARAGFKRNDHRVKKKFWQKMNQRMQKRTKQYLNKITKQIVKNAKQSKSMIVLEDLKGIRKLYKKGNGQGNKYRRRLNGWPFYEFQRQIQYKADWEGIPVKFVDPKRTSKLCPICGDRIQEDTQNRRKLWCSNCGKSMDRDVVASMNIAHKGWARFIHPRGDIGEAQSGVFEPAMTESTSYEQVAIRIVDVSKSSLAK